MKPASTLPLVAALIGGASCKRVLQDIIPEAGQGPTRPATSSSSQAESSTTATEEEEEELLEALEANDQIDAMVLYGVSNLTDQGGITPQHMETPILERLGGTNKAMVNAGVAVYMNPVHIGLLPYEVTTTHGSATTLADFQSNGNVGILRDLCWCGDETIDHTIKGESTACKRACTGDADAICGGFNAMSV